MLCPATFNALTIRQKADVLLQQGKFLYTRREPAFNVDRYKLNEFYVEIFFPNDSTAQAIFRSFEAGEIAVSFLPEEKIHYLYQYIVCSHTA